MADDENYFEKLQAACQNRRMFATTYGRIGLGPPDLQPEDMIFAFIGAETLFALRPISEGNFKLIGDAYVDGLMFREAFEAARGNTSGERIVLV